MEFHLFNKHKFGVKPGTQQNSDTTANNNTANDDVEEQEGVNEELEEQPAESEDTVIQPDLNNTHFCKKCKINLGTTIKYRKHLTDKYGIKFKSMTNRRSKLLQKNCLIQEIPISIVVFVTTTTQMPSTLENIVEYFTKWKLV